MQSIPTSDSHPPDSPAWLHCCRVISWGWTCRDGAPKSPLLLGAAGLHIGGILGAAAAEYSVSWQEGTGSLYTVGCMGIALHYWKEKTLSRTHTFIWCQEFNPIQMAPHSIKKLSSINHWAGAGHFPYISGWRIHCSRDPVWISHHAHKGKGGNLHWNLMEKQIYCCNICTMWAGGTTVGTAGGLTQTLIICTVMHVVAQRLRSRSMTEVGYLAGKADVWSCAIPPSASGESSHRARAESAGPLGSPHTEMALRRDRTWKGRIIWSSKLVSLLNLCKQLGMWPPKQKYTPDQEPTSLLWETGRCNDAEECKKSCFHPHTWQQGARPYSFQHKFLPPRTKACLCFWNCSPDFSPMLTWARSYLKASLW